MVLTINFKTALLLFLLTSTLFSNEIDLKKINGDDVKVNLNRSFATMDKNILETTNEGDFIDIEDKIKMLEEKPKKEKAKPAPIVFDTENKEPMFYNLLLIQDQKRRVLFTSYKDEKVSYYGSKDTKAKNTKKRREELAYKSLTPSTRKFEAYCQVNSTIDVFNTPTKRELSCKSKDKKIYFTLDLILIPKDDAKILIGQADTIQIDLNNNGNEEIISIDANKSMILNASGSSENLATYVNDRAIEKALAIGIKEVSSSMAKGTQDTLQEYKAYKKEQKAVTDSNGNVTKVTNTSKPDVATNVTYAVIEGAFKMGEKIIDETKVNLPYHYRVLKNSLIKVKLLEKKQGEKDAVN